MSGLRGPVYVSRSTKTKNLIGIAFSLFVVRSICALLTSSQAPASKAQADANPPGKIVFENSEVVGNTAPALTVTAISPTSGTTSSMKLWFASFRHLVIRSFEENVVDSRGETVASTVWAKIP